MLASRCSAIFFGASRSWTPFLARSLTTSTIPPPRGSVNTPEEFLKSIGRSMETKYSAESWEEFWTKTGANLKEAGLAIRDRRYMLWCMSKYRRGFPLEEFVHEPPPKKTVRGWGPSVQNGKRIRSRVHQDKSKKKKKT
ncbi:uncharacterized protein ARMOST_10809 [Armillaria ostoyae]|uniref:Small ribosomal subunit protein mS41 n=2 Tax=Armillaria TaxID=47424 RepID=A0A284RFD0_ARMOS|nr:hypothetical protein ARMSODRAFT_950852 [Armillaria solidipes]SJL07459.1 uncharacterized protein ARMOST_10809 [Armillaria ostoyae]